MKTQMTELIMVRNVNDICVMQLQKKARNDFGGKNDPLLCSQLDTQMIRNGFNSE